jgi:hypothetical protein
MWAVYISVNRVNLFANIRKEKRSHFTPFSGADAS